MEFHFQTCIFQPSSVHCKCVSLSVGLYLRTFSLAGWQSSLTEPVLIFIKSSEQYFPNSVYKMHFFPIGSKATSSANELGINQNESINLNLIFLWKICVMSSTVFVNDKYCSVLFGMISILTFTPVANLLMNKWPSYPVRLSIITGIIRRL